MLNPAVPGVLGLIFRFVDGYKKIPPIILIVFLTNFFFFLGYNKKEWYEENRPEGQVVLAAAGCPGRKRSPKLRPIARPKAGFSTQKPSAATIAFRRSVGDLAEDLLARPVEAAERASREGGEGPDASLPAGLVAAAGDQAVAEGPDASPPVGQAVAAAGDQAAAEGLDASPPVGQAVAAAGSLVTDAVKDPDASPPVGQAAAAGALPRRKPSLKLKPNARIKAGFSTPKLSAATIAFRRSVEDLAENLPVGPAAVAAEDPAAVAAESLATDAAEDPDASLPAGPAAVAAEDRAADADPDASLPVSPAAVEGGER